MNTITRDSYRSLSDAIFRHQPKFLFVDTVLLLSIIVSTVVILYILKKSNKLLIPSLILLHNIAMSAAICIISAIFVLLVDDLGNVDLYNSTMRMSTVISACILAAGLLCLVCLFAIVIKSKNKVLLIILSAVVLLCAGNAGVSYVKAKTYSKTIEDATLRMETAAYTYNAQDFISITADEVNQKIQNKDEFILYLGRVTSEWCRELVPLLNTLAQENNWQIYYLDTENTDSDETLKSFRETYAIETVPEIVLFDENGNVRRVEHNITALDFSKESLYESILAVLNESKA